ncbi:hypothetical protein MOO45_06110 [Bombilactobacillus folatiphilus]|uniref:Lysozyme n=1 Tax=Bombilactobacillus folatiphilus TaxID=2923362 RepID=A0ABY4P7Z7_9LACO|nr:GH25 family lysozyme [Bombilactobacillus folatiphilus]UQS81773.1 hypothetical protein MOO45_06110 [Bombilactobacillus folatiphilus]
MREKYQLRHQKKHSWNGKFIFLGFICGLLVILFVGSRWLRYWQGSGRPSQSDYPILGVSLSQTDGYQDFHLLKKHGVDFVYLKATQGANYFDDDFLDSYWRIQGAQLPVGVYHYFSFDTSAKAQFQNFRASVGQQIGTLPLVIQVPFSKQQLPHKQQVQRSVSQLRGLLVKYYQRPVLIQTTPQLSYLLKTNPDGGWLQAHPYPIKGNQVHFWQYTTSGRIPSLASDNRYNLSVFNGRQAQWEQYLQGGF